FTNDLVEEEKPGIYGWIDTFMRKQLRGPAPTGLLKVVEVPSGRTVASFNDDSFSSKNGKQFAYLPDGKGIAILKLSEGIIEIWDLPPRRPIWVDYGLPALFILLLLYACWSRMRRRRKVAISEEVTKDVPAPCEPNSDPSLESA